MDGSYIRQSTDILQKLQKKGFSPVCVLEWTVNALCWMKHLLQPFAPQWYGLLVVDLIVSAEIRVAIEALVMVSQGMGTVGV